MHGELQQTYKFRSLRPQLFDHLILLRKDDFRVMVIQYLEPLVQLVESLLLLLLLLLSAAVAHSYEVIPARKDVSPFSAEHHQTHGIAISPMSAHTYHLNHVMLSCNGLSSSLKGRGLAPTH